MHELSIAEAVLDVALRHADGRRVMAVELRVGHLRQVVPPALEFAFELVAHGTVLEGAELRMEVVPAEGVCRACGAESRFDGFPLRCSACDGFDVEVVRGEELLVDSLELESNPRIREARTPSGLATSGG